MTLRAIHIAIAVSLCCLGPLSRSHAADASAPPDLSHAVAIIIADGESNGVKRFTRATGFFIDSQGTFVTSYHVKSKLGPIDPATLDINVYVDETSNTKLPAREIYASESTDVLVLRVTLGNNPVIALPLGDWRRVKLNQTTLYTAGFPEGLPRLFDHGFVTGFRGPTHAPALVWTTNFNFKEGQSGSPIVDESGRVVGLVRGVDEAAPFIGFIVPVSAVPTNYWESIPGNDPAALSPAAGPTLVATASVPATEPRRRRINVAFANKACDPPTEFGKIVTATPGWQIIPASVKLSTLKAVGPAVRASVSTADPSQISVAASLANFGTCVRLQSVVLYPDTPGTYQGELDYNETPLPGTRLDVTVARTALTPGRPVSVTTGELQNLRVAVVQPDGSTTAVPTSRNTVSSRKGVLKINPNGILAGMR